MKKIMLSLLSMALFAVLSIIVLAAATKDNIRTVPKADAASTISNSIPRTSEAFVVSPYGYMYSDSSLDESKIILSIPRGKAVTVVDSDVSDTVCKIQYAGITGYIRENNLKSHLLTSPFFFH